MDLDELRVKNALRCTLLSYSKNAGATLDLLRGLHKLPLGGWIRCAVKYCLAVGDFDVNLRVYVAPYYTTHLKKVFRPD
jgi:hypothetical protein